MPLPEPKNKEKQGEFISRCAGDKESNKKFPDQKQRLGYCYTAWKEAKKKAMASLGEGADEMLFGYECPECIAAQKTYSGKKRSELKDSDFLFPETRSFPIVSPQDVRDAINNFGRMGGNMSYDAFIKLLYKKARSKGQAFVDAIPDKTKKEHKLTASDEVAGEGAGEEAVTEEIVTESIVKEEVVEQPISPVEHHGETTACDMMENEPGEGPQHEMSETPEEEKVEDEQEGETSDFVGTFFPVLK